MFHLDHRQSQRCLLDCAARISKFVLLLGLSIPLSEFMLQNVCHWSHGAFTVSMVTEARADDDDGGGGEASGGESSGGESSGGESKGRSESSREGSERRGESYGEDSDRGSEASEEDGEERRGGGRESKRDGSRVRGVSFRAPPRRDRDDDREGRSGKEDGTRRESSEKRADREEADSDERESRDRRRGSRDGGAEYDRDTPRARNEILAVNLSRDGARQARRLGFKIGGSRASRLLRGNVTRLVPPRNITAAQARGLMRRAQPNERIAVNQRYRVYQPARNNGPERGERMEPARHGPGMECVSTRCFGRSVIRWRNEIESCASGLRVGVIDTQVDHQHPAFSRAKINMGGFLPEGVKPAPAWHGTGVLSVLAGDSDSGTPGLIPQATFYIANVFSQDEKGELEADTVSILGALEWMSAFDVQVINMSFSGPKDDLIEETIERMSRDGVIFVAAAGNGGPTVEPTYPAAYSAVVAVTAVSKDLRNYLYASRGDSIDASAPGVDIWSAVPNGREGFHTGTSFAAPYVTAMLATLYNERADARNKDELLNQLKVIDLGPPGRDPIYGRGLMLAPTSCGGGNGKWVAPALPSRGEPIPAAKSGNAIEVAEGGNVTVISKRSINTTNIRRAVPSGKGLGFR